MIRVGFTGSRYGMNDYQRQEVMRWLMSLNPNAHRQRAVLNHGDCKGADAEAHQLALALGYWKVIHPPENSVNRAFCVGEEVRPVAEYLIRNIHIVDESDIMLATPKGVEEPRSGTWHAIRYTKRVGKPVVVILPGVTQVFNRQPWMRPE